MATYQSYSTVFSEQLGGSDEQILVTIEYGADFTGDGFDDIRVAEGREEAPRARNRLKLGALASRRLLTTVRPQTQCQHKAKHKPLGAPAARPTRTP